MRKLIFSLLATAMTFTLMSPLPASASGQIPLFDRPGALDPGSPGSYTINPPTAYKDENVLSKFWLGEITSGTVNSYNCQISSGSLPTGLSLGAATNTSVAVTCPLVGDTDNANGVFNFTFTMTIVDSNSTTLTRSEAYSVTVGSGGGGQSNKAEQPQPAKYSGPEFSALSGVGIMTGSTGKLEGKRLDQISTIEIGGKAATFTAASAESLELTLPKGLAPGLYDLVINSSAGKLTHINAIRVREPLKSVSVTTLSRGSISNDQYLEHSLVASMQVPELTRARCVVNASSVAAARAQAERLCAIVKASNPNIETTIVEARSTVRNNSVFARVVYGWN